MLLFNWKKEYKGGREEEGKRIEGERNDYNVNRIFFIKFYYFNLFGLYRKCCVEIIINLSINFINYYCFVMFW